MLQRYLIGSAALASLAFTAGCGGSDGGPPPGCDCPAPIRSSANLALGPEPTVVDLTQARAQWSVNVTLPAVTGTPDVTVATSSTPPSGAALHGPVTFLGYVSIVSSTSFTFPTSPSFSFVDGLPSAGVQYYVAYLPPGASAWTEPTFGPATTYLNSYGFNALDQPLSIVAGSTYGFAFYSVPAGTYP